LPVDNLSAKIIFFAELFEPKTIGEDVCYLQKVFKKHVQKMSGQGLFTNPNSNPAHKEHFCSYHTIVSQKLWY
jgi:hypothetical protein